MISLTSQAPTSPPTHVKKLCCYYLLMEHLRLTLLASVKYTQYYFFLT